MSEHRLRKIFTKNINKLAGEVKIPKSTLYRYDSQIPNAINMSLIKKLAKHAKLTVAEFMKAYFS